MNKILITIIIVVVLVGGGVFLASKGSKMQSSQQMAANQPSGAMAQGVMVGGAAMTPDKDIVDNAVNSKDHTTLVAAVNAAGLVDTLKGKGPYTVFAPTNHYRT